MASNLAYLSWVISRDSLCRQYMQGQLGEEVLAGDIGHHQHRGGRRGIGHLQSVV